MWDWLTQLTAGSPTARPKTRTPSCTAPRRPRPMALEPLEARALMAVNVQLDFTYDTLGFFNDPTRRAILQQAANDLGSHLDTQLAAITPGGPNTWTATFFDPATGQQRSVANPVVGANTILVYVGGRNATGSEAGEGGPGGYGASGYQDWFNTLQTRGAGGFAPWGGSIAFDTGTNWFFGSTTDGIGANQVDFYSVASHELGHLLGLGTSQQWTSLVSGGTFHGGNADAVYGGAVPVYGDNAHWADGLTYGGTRGSMDPILVTGTRVPFSSLDYAALRDIGWRVDGSGGSGGSGPATPAPPQAPPITPPPLGSNQTPVVLTGPVDGSARAYTLNADGTLNAVGTPMTPFAGWGGVVRTLTADFNGDGVQDYAFATGPGTAAQVRVVDGKTGQDLAAPTLVLDGFGGGVFIAAGDMDRDGAAELAVSADAGGGNRISIYKVTGGGLQRVIDFMAFGDPNFRGGSRVALGDVNRDGAADLIVGAGIGGGPRIAVYNGAALVGGQAVQLVPDFFALDPALRSGVFVTAADLDGDGYADVLYSTGNTGGPRVRVVSGAVLTANPGQDAYSLPAMADFFALDPNDRNGIRLTAKDLNGDGKAELIVGGGSKDSPVVRVFSWDNLGKSNPPLVSPFTDPATVDGVYVG